VKTFIPLLILAIVVFISWATGLVVFTYEHPVVNQPLQHPCRVQIVNGTNMLLEDGRMITFWPRWSSDRSDEAYEIVSNQVRRSDFQIDIETNAFDLCIFVRYPRKFRDSAPPFEIPIIRHAVGRYGRQIEAVGKWVQTGNKTN
jgi:hypothetical protein